MPVNCDFLEKANNERLMAAMIAATGCTLTATSIHKYFNDPTVKYNAVEFYFRKIRQQAKTLQAEVDGTEPLAPKEKKPKAKVTPKKDGVKTGRVSKKKVDNAKVSKEAVEDALDTTDEGEDLLEGLGGPVKMEPVDEAEGFDDEEV